MTTGRMLVQTWSCLKGVDSWLYIFSGVFEREWVILNCEKRWKKAQKTPSRMENPFKQIKTSHSSARHP